MKFIVRSLGRYSDESIITEDGETIQELQMIVDKAEDCLYPDFLTFNAEILEMLNILESEGEQVCKVRKHFRYLVDFYFPTYITTGKRSRNSKK